MLTTKKLLDRACRELRPVSLDICLNTSIETDWITDGKILYRKNARDHRTALAFSGRRMRGNVLTLLMGLFSVERQLDVWKGRRSTVYDHWSYAYLDDKAVISLWDWQRDYVEFLVKRFPDVTSTTVVHPWRKNPPILLVDVDNETVAALTGVRL